MTTASPPFLACWEKQLYLLNTWIEHLIPSAPLSTLLIHKLEVQNDILVLYAESDIPDILPALEAKLIAFQSAIFNAQPIPIVKLKRFEENTDE